MAVQRKIFRIEETMQALLHPDAADPVDAPSLHLEILNEIRGLRAAIDERPRAQTAVRDVQSSDVRKLKIELDVIGDAIRQTRTEIVSLQDQGFNSSRVARVVMEMDAVTSDTSGATNRILKAAEEIDESANALMGLVRNSHEHGLAQDIQDRVTTIFEACNFHDLTGQRISKVATTLKMVEDHLARMMEIWSVIERFNIEAVQSTADNIDNLLNGPKLAGDNGHSTQDEIDNLFR